MIKGVKFVTIAVRDQERALEFYTSKLGMRVITDSPFDGTQRWIELGIPRASTKIVLFTSPGFEQLIGKFQNITFETSCANPNGCAPTVIVVATVGVAAVVLSTVTLPES